MTILTGSGHASPVDAPVLFNQAVSEFLNAVDAASRSG
jgi:pimeloyl-ACP methyl ester carboxylesterase